MSDDANVRMVQGQPSRVLETQEWCINPPLGSAWSEYKPLFTDALIRATCTIFAYTRSGRARDLYVHPTLRRLMECMPGYKKSRILQQTEVEGVMCCAWNVRYSDVNLFPGEILVAGEGVSVLIQVTGDLSIFILDLVIEED